MTGRTQRVLWLVVPILFAGRPIVAQERDVERLIDQLVNISEPGFGYSAFFAGSEFLPYANTGEMHVFVIGASHATRSEALRQIVEKGVDVVPSLIGHLDDRRKIKMAPVRGMGWMLFPDEYDFNQRTARKVPPGVNRNGVEDNNRPKQHTVTVGDLCFVALGQIVNRNFCATRYQPSGGVVVNSPTYSEALRKAIIKEWSGVTKEQHRNSLLQDFAKPDHEERRIGAYLRLAFYYPDAVEEPVLNELAKPTFDALVVQDLCRETLYDIQDATERQRTYEDFLRQHGNVYGPAVRDYLFGDLSMVELYEQSNPPPKRPDFGTAPRELLIQLFDLPPDVTSEDRPHLEAASQSERARLIENLVHDDSRKIGDVVRRLFENSADDQDLASACLRCLASRGYADFLLQQLDKIDVRSFETNDRHCGYIQAISHSREERLRERLLEIIKTTPNDDYFMAALPAVDRKHDVVLQQARRVLAGFPEDTDRGRDLLRMIGERFPDEAEAIYRGFLIPGSIKRAMTMCGVLWGHPLSKSVLAPLLDDKRVVPGLVRPFQVRDLAAKAIKHATDATEN